MLDIRILQYFLMVSREKNITKAANSLHITQPTLSRQLMQLEEQIGKTLMIRTKHGIELTKDGMLLRRRAEEIVHLAEKTEKELKEETDDISGEIFIGCGETDIFRLISHTIKSFVKYYPNVKFNLFSGTADDIKERISNGMIDIALLNEPVEISNYEFIRLPQKERWGVAMLKSDPLAEKETISPKDLVNKKIIMSTRGLVKQEIENWFGDYYEQVEEVASINLFHNAFIMIEEGIACGITLENLVKMNQDNRICFRPFYPTLETGCVIAWKKHQIFSPATSRFIKELKNDFKA